MNCTSVSVLKAHEVPYSEVKNEGKEETLKICQGHSKFMRKSDYQDETEKFQ